MKTKKRKIIIFISIVIILTITACSDNNSNTPVDTISPATSPEVVSPPPAAESVRSVTVDGAEVSAGDVITHGAMIIDNDSVISIDDNSKLIVTEISEDKFVLTLQEGAIHGDISSRSDSDEYEIIAGDSVLSIHGTSFIAGFDGKDNPVFIMLEGIGEVDGTQLTNGNLAIAEEDGIVIEQFKDSNDFLIFAGHEWHILEQQSDTAFIISTSSMLGTHPYHAELVDITWEHSDIRAYLNNDFYNSLSPAHQERIIETSLENNDNQNFGTPGGNDTVDKVFLLSIDEAALYLLREDNRINTMLRSPGSDGSRAALLAYTEIYHSGNPVTNGNAGLRPAMWIKLEYNDVILRALRVLGRDFIDIDSLPAIIPAPLPPELADNEWIIRDLSERGITDEQLADMVANGQIPSNVHSLLLSKNPISDLSPIAELTDLRVLYLDFCPLIDLSPLSGLTDLISLSTGIFDGEGMVTDITPLTGLTNMTYLNIHGHLVSDLAPLRGMTNLDNLSAGYKVRDISALSRLTSLNVLSIGGSQLRDLTPIQGLTGLRQLSVIGTQVSNLSPLSDMTDMFILTLITNQISDLSPLSGMKNLWNLDVRFNQVTDLTPLHGLTELGYVSIRENPVVKNQEQIDALQNALPKVQINQ